MRKKTITDSYELAFEDKHGCIQCFKEPDDSVTLTVRASYGGGIETIGEGGTEINQEYFLVTISVNGEREDDGSGYLKKQGLVGALLLTEPSGYNKDLKDFDFEDYAYYEIHVTFESEIELERKELTHED